MKAITQNQMFGKWKNVDHYSVESFIASASTYLYTYSMYVNEEPVLNMQGDEWG